MNTLTALDVASGWTECIAVWGKGQNRDAGAIHHIKERLLFTLLGIDSDNGSEFINQHLYNYCQQREIIFTGLVLIRKMITVMWSKRIET